MRRASLIALAAFVAGCNSPTAPVDHASVHGRLSGIVTIGPICPVEQPGNPCPTPPSAYMLRKVLVFDEQRTRLLHTVDIDTQGLYVIDLAPGRYLIDIKGSALDRSKDVPKVVEIHANIVTMVNISIDTGIR